jgi:hypothetical protein
MKGKLPTTPKLPKNPKLIECHYRATPFTPLLPPFFRVSKVLFFLPIAIPQAYNFPEMSRFFHGFT